MQRILEWVEITCACTCIRDDVCMDPLATYFTTMSTYAGIAIAWMSEHVTAGSTLLQVAAIMGVYVVGALLAKRSAIWLEGRLKLRDRRTIIRVNVSYTEIFSLLYFAVFLWFATAVMQAAELPFQLIRTVASLATAWAIIRVTSSTIESRFWSRIIASILWVLAALNIVGWLSEAIAIMAAAAIKIGGVELSLLLVVKSVLAFAVLLWAVGFLSGALERSFNKASGITPSQRVLFFKLSNIALYILAGIVGLNIVGLDLAALAVFSGALGLGIGFGLQKVFSNLISGIILLLDKSVKPGDVIAIGDTFGWVNSLGARCVSVLTRDGKEHLIPNENLITQEVENWSYSDQKLRIHIPIGVSYGSDVHLVKKLLLQAVEEHPRILKDSKPICFITGFGDNSIDHEVRAWITDPAAGINNVRSDIYYRVWDLFKEHGVEIPFPQRDVHMKLDEHSPLYTLLERALAR